LSGMIRGSELSFASGSAINRITAGVKARRDRSRQVSICWPGLHPPGKVSFERKKEYSIASATASLTRDIGRFRTTYREHIGNSLRLWRQPTPRKPPKRHALKSPLGPRNRSEEAVRRRSSSSLLLWACCGFGTA
jgi:hypothetical protein